MDATLTRSATSKITVWTTVAVFLLYAISGSVLASATGQSIATLEVWSASVRYPGWAAPVILLFGLSGVAIALVVPTLAWTWALSLGRVRAASLFHRAFALNLIQAVAFIGLWKAVAGETPPRVAFVAWQGLVALTGLLVSARTEGWRGAQWRDGGRLIAVGALALLLGLPLSMWGKVFVENGSDDGTEQFEFSRSLDDSQLPHWDLENGFFGFYPSFMLFAYPTHLTFIAIGETEAAQRLPVFFYLFGIYLVLAELIRRRRRAVPWPDLLLLVGAATFFVVYHVNHSSYEIVVDIAEPTGVDTFFTFLIAAAFYELGSRRRAWWGLFACLGTMALAAGLPFVALILAGRVLTRRPRWRWTAVRPHVWDALAFAAPYSVYQIFVAMYTARYPIGVTKWSLDRIFEQYPLRVDGEVAAIVLANFAIVTAMVPLLGLWPTARDRTGRTLGVMVIGYLALLILCGRTNPHYLIPLTLFPAAAFLRMMGRAGVARAARLTGLGVYGGALLILVAMAIPKERAPHTVYREFGARTLMLYDSYADVVTAAEGLVSNRPGIYIHLLNGKALRSDVPVPLELPPAVAEEEHSYVEARVEDIVSRHNAAATARSPWGLRQHIWVRYADRVPQPGRRYDQILAAPHLAPAEMSGFARRELPDGFVLFFRPGESIFTWLAAAPAASAQ